MVEVSPEEEAQGWVAFGSLQDIPRGCARVLPTLLCNIAVFRTNDDRIYALEDFCPHKGAPLSYGQLEGARVICPLHGWEINLADGRVAFPNGGSVRSFPVRVDDGEIFVRTLPVR